LSNAVHVIIVALIAVHSLRDYLSFVSLYLRLLACLDLDP